jgi:hypothetical protein
LGGSIRRDIQLGRVIERIRRHLVAPASDLSSRAGVATQGAARSDRQSPCACGGW